MANLYDNDGRLIFHGSQFLAEKIQGMFDAYKQKTILELDLFEQLESYPVIPE